MNTRVALLAFALQLAPAHAAPDPDLVQALRSWLIVEGSGEFFFAPGATTLDESQRERLRRRIGVLASAPKGWTIHVEGSADGVGPAWANVQLANTRAQHVADLLVAHGVPRARIVVEEPRPFVRTAVSRAWDRRVVVRIQTASGT